MSDRDTDVCWRSFTSSESSERPNAKASAPLTLCTSRRHRHQRTDRRHQHWSTCWAHAWGRSPQDRRPAPLVRRARVSLPTRPQLPSCAAGAIRYRGYAAAAQSVPPHPSHSARRDAPAGAHRPTGGRHAPQERMHATVANARAPPSSHGSAAVALPPVKATLRCRSLTPPRPPPHAATRFTRKVVGVAGDCICHAHDPVEGERPAATEVLGRQRDHNRTDLERLARRRAPACACTPPPRHHMVGSVAVDARMRTCAVRACACTSEAVWRTEQPPQLVHRRRG